MNYNMQKGKQGSRQCALVNCEPVRLEFRGKVLQTSDQRFSITFHRKIRQIDYWSQTRRGLEPKISSEENIPPIKDTSL